MDQAKVLDEKKNPFFEHGEAGLFLAEDANGEVIGRVAGIRNGMHLEKYDDGNGFFGDAYFDPDVWIDGLTKMATMFAGVPNVVGMSLRNELRGPRQNAKDWYR